MSPKKISHRDITGDRGIALIHTIVGDMGFVWNATGLEAGIDGYIEIRDVTTGDVTNLIIQVQSKATGGTFSGETSEGFDFYCDPRDLEYWLGGNAPVILVCSRPSTNEAYWVSIKDYFKDLSTRGTRKIHFNKFTDKFDRSCNENLASLAKSKDSGIYLASLPKEEKVISNLLEVSSFAQKIYIAETDVHDRREMWHLLRHHVPDVGGASMLTSVAQVFNERGEGIIVRGGPATFSKEDKQVHLNQADAEKLLYNALSLYKKEHGNFPARLVVHKTSSYARAEIDGFVAASRSYQVDQIDLISITHSFTRLFRIGSYPPLRGTFLSLDEKNHLLYTRGSIDFFQTYPGMYVPRSLMFRCEYTEQTPKFLAQEIMGLTKMNWNNTQFDGGYPITIRTARRVGEILKYVPEDKDVAPSYKFYM